MIIKIYVNTGNKINIKTLLDIIKIKSIIQNSVFKKEGNYGKK